MTGGDVTATFPAKPVFIQTELGPGAAEYEMKDILYDGNFLPRSCLPDGVFWTQVGHYSISCPARDMGEKPGYKEYHEPPIAPTWANSYKSRAEYWLTISPKSADLEEALLGLKFIGRVYPTEYAPGYNKILLEQDVRMTLGKTALIGFPKFTTEGRKSTPRGAVYILAVLVRREGI